MEDNDEEQDNVDVVVLSKLMILILNKQFWISLSTFLQARNQKIVQFHVHIIDVLTMRNVLQHEHQRRRKLIPVTTTPISSIGASRQINRHIWSEIIVLYDLIKNKYFILFFVLFFFNCRVIFTVVFIFLQCKEHSAARKKHPFTSIFFYGIPKGTLALG